MVRFFSDIFNGISLTCGIEDGNVVSLKFGAASCASPEPDGLWEKVREELREYFAGERRNFDLPLQYGGTAFQTAVWAELLRIPYGRTRSYGEVARAIGRPKAARAVGQACHVNPIVILIPCHRVTGAAGELKLYDTPERDAAMVMAIVADELKIPINELRFISIREVRK